MDWNTFIGAFVLGFACGVCVVRLYDHNQKADDYIEPSKPWPKNASWRKCPQCHNKFISGDGSLCPKCSNCTFAIPPPSGR